MTTSLIGDNKRAVTINNRSDYTHDPKQLILHASVTAGGRVLALYEEITQPCRTRMQIEKGLRDIKNRRTGFSLSDTPTRSIE